MKTREKFEQSTELDLVNAFEFVYVYAYYKNYRITINSVTLHRDELVVDSGRDWAISGSDPRVKIGSRSDPQNKPDPVTISNYSHCLFTLIY